MRIVKYGHACVRLEKQGRALVIDPGLMTPETDVLRDVDAVLVTHEHFDHFDADRLVAAAAENPRLTVYTCPGVARHLAQIAERVQVVGDGDVFSAAGFGITVAGSKHHHSHPDAAPVDNVGFVVDGEVFHPGDALTVVDVPVLLVPGQAPWMTVPDLVAYLRTMAPRRAFAVHDGLLNDWGLSVLDNVLAAEADRSGTEIRRLKAGEAVDV